jgi:AmiR/NasT family two-component response regulator
MGTSHWPRCWQTLATISWSAPLSCRSSRANSLKGALESRVAIEKAKGITAQHNTVLFDQAYQLMHRHAHNNNTRLPSVAETIVAAGLQV